MRGVTPPQTVWPRFKALFFLQSKQVFFCFVFVFSFWKLHEIFAVEDFMHGKTSCSVKFFGKDEKEIFSIYLPRNEKREYDAEIVEKFNKL